MLWKTVVDGPVAVQDQNPGQGPVDNLKQEEENFYGKNQ